MARFKLQPDATFRAKVAIPVPGSGDTDVEFVFKYRDRAEVQAFLDTQASSPMTDTEAILAMCTGWDLTDAFDAKSIDTLVANYITAPALIWEKYLGELTKVRTKN